MIELIEGPARRSRRHRGRRKGDRPRTTSASSRRPWSTLWRRTAKIRLLHVIGDRVEGHTVDALWEDTRLGLSNVRSIERIAVVTDLARFRALVKGAGWALPGECRLFSNAERGDAITWVSENLRTEA